MLLDWVDAKSKTTLNYMLWSVTNDVKQQGVPNVSGSCRDGYNFIKWRQKVREDSSLAVKMAPV